VTTTQSEDPHERVNHPRHYNQHPSGVECIEIIEHLPCNLANAMKYIWRAGLKQSSDPLRDLRSAQWYALRERERIERFGLKDIPKPRTDIVWQSLARRVIEDAKTRETHDLVAFCLGDLMRDDLAGLLDKLEREILGAW
jgi:hypothetical protein